MYFISKNDFYDRNSLFLKHIGNKNSGRYRKGSGDRPFQHVSKYLLRTEKSGKDKPLTSKAERLSKDVKNATDELSSGVMRITNAIDKKHKSKSSKNKMTDEELSRAIRRIEMERRYASLTNSEISKGKEIVSTILSTAGTVTSLAASGVAIAAGIYNIKK